MLRSCCLRDTHHPARRHWSSSSALRYTEVTRKNAKYMAADPTFTWAVSGLPTPLLLSSPVLTAPALPLVILTKPRWMCTPSPHPPSSFTSVVLPCPTHCSLIHLRACPCDRAGWHGGQQDLGLCLTCHGSSRGDQGDTSIPLRELALSLPADNTQPRAQHFFLCPRSLLARSVRVSQVWASLLATL